MMKIVFATNNEHKLREVRQILGNRYEVLSLEDIGCHADIPETAETLDGNALQKARYVYVRYGMDVFADDTGLEVEALDGAPGVRTARYAGEAHDTKANVDLLLRNMENKENRRACFRTAIALIQSGQEHVFEGRVDGEITRQREGEAGFGYDPVFRPEGYDGTFAQLGEDVKNTISHRARAVAQLARWLGILLLFVLPFVGNAQVVGTWSLYPAYGNVQQVIRAGDMVWAVSGGNLWSVDADMQEITVFDRLRGGLNDVEIVRIACSPAKHCIMVVYANANIDIIDTNTHSVFNIAAIKDSDFAKKDINDICMHGSRAWLATSFGIVVINLDEYFVEATYQYTKGVHSVAVSDNAKNALGTYVPVEPTLFAATDDGVLYAPLTANPYDMSSMGKVTSGVGSKLLWWKGYLMMLAGGQLIHCTLNAGLKYIGGIRDCTGMYDCNDKLLITGSKGIYCMSADQQVTSLMGTNTIVSIAGNGDGVFFAACGFRGLEKYSIADDGAMVQISTGVMPDGPRLENYRRMSYAGQHLLVASGGGDAEGRQWIFSSLSVLKDGSWINLDTTTVNKTHPYHNVMDIVEDPRDPEHRFACSYGSGLFEYQGMKLINRYTDDNSPIVKAAANADEYTRVSALAYDSDGNLWMNNSNVDTVIVYRTPDGKWGKYYNRDFCGMTMPDNITIDGNSMWFVSGYHATLSKIGILYVDNNGTPTDKKDDRVCWHGNPIVQQDNLKYMPRHIYCTIPDKEGQVWVGTDMGLFVIPSAEEFMSPDFTYQQIKINRNDGSGLADYLFNGIWITAIQVDGANRKWIGTDGQGVYLISADGQEQLQHFTTENSPLPSNHVTSLAINSATGQLMIGTIKGLAGYVSDAIEPEDTLDEDKILVYPNPVPPDYNGCITIKGLTSNAEVKIATATGQVIYRTHSNGGLCTWNCRDARGRRVATGIYNIISNTSNGSDAVVNRIIVTN